MSGENRRNTRIFVAIILVIALIMGLSACSVKPKQGDVPKEEMKPEDKQAQSSNQEPKKEPSKPFDIKVELPEEQKDIPEEVIAYAKDYVQKRIAEQNDLVDASYRFIDAKITGLKHFDNGVASEIHAVHIYQLEYRLLPDKPKKVQLNGGMQMDGDWLTEHASTGQPILVFLQTQTDVETWDLIAVSDTTVMQQHFTDENIKEFGDGYTAFAAQMLERFKLDTK